MRCPDDPFVAWADALTSNPSEAVSDVLEGRGSRGAMQSSEPGDFLADLLAQPSLQARREALVEAIDGALIEWMDERIVWSPDRVARFGTRAYVVQFSDALASVARLPLSLSPTRLIEDAAAWDDRFRSLRWPEDIDLLRQFDLVLAQHQLDERFASRWFASCDEASWAGPYWRDSLGIGLLGLRKIPDPTNAQPERLVATALARFAALSSQRSTDSPELRAEFRRHVSTLTVLYPRNYSRWKETWASALASLRGFRHHRSVARDSWLRPALPSQYFPDIDPGSNEPARRNWARAARRPEHLPQKADLHEVVRAVDAAQALDDALWREAHRLINRHWAYARYTHHSYYAVRTTHNLCDRLLRKRPSDAQLAEIHKWTLQALQAESGNPYVWDLWAKVLAALGVRETSLDIRWEAVRRFPNEVVPRTALIVALASSGRRKIAEHLFDQTYQDFPNDVIEPRLLRTQSWRGPASAVSARYADVALAKRVQKVISDEQLFRSVGGQRSSTESAIEPQLRPVLASLRNRSELLERYFAPASEVSVIGDGAAPDPPTTELELVVACRTGAWPQPGDESLDSWLAVRPASYSAHLLALSRSINGHGPDRDELARVRSAFPQYHHWNQWLGYQFAGPGERAELRKKAREQELWGGRLSAVYPDLDVPYSRSVVPKPGPLRRLFEDVALANAGAGLPQLSVA